MDANSLFAGAENAIADGLNDGSQFLAGLGLPMTTEKAATSPLQGTANAASQANPPSDMSHINTRPGLFMQLATDVETVLESPTSPSSWPILAVLAVLVIGGGLFFFRKDLLKPLLKGV